MAEQKDEEEDIVIGPELQGLVSKNEKDFGRIAKNMQRQLERLKNRLATLKDENNQLRIDIKNSKKQCEIMTDECKEKNEDIKIINKNYSTKQQQDAWDKLLADIVNRQNSLKDDLNESKFKMTNIDRLNKDYQEQIKRIGNNAINAANSNDKDLLIEEMEARTMELKTLQDVMKGKADVQELDEMLNDLKDRHNVQSGKDKSAKEDEKISDENALKDNANWEKLLNEVVDEYKNGSSAKWLKELNGLYLMEMEDRISDLREIKDIFDAKYIEKAQQESINEKTEELIGNISKRHKDTESKAKNVLPQSDVPTKQMENEKQLNAFSLGNEKWRRQINTVVKTLFAEE